jgi:hypothetical protein
LELKKSKDRTQVREPEANLGHQFFFEVEKGQKAGLRCGWCVELKKVIERTQFPEPKANLGHPVLCLL